MTTLTLDSSQTLRLKELQEMLAEVATDEDVESYKPTIALFYCEPCQTHCVSTCATGCATCGACSNTCSGSCKSNCLIQCGQCGGGMCGSYGALVP